ncbi:hypothetical protein DMA11_09710 [Marinilabiliaceae bacterium JC017]|nr:hypothetical protein DMA11_09710 [Marinilabiliaceae bacterium JC017]
MIHLEALEFTRRFVQYVLRSGFYKICYFGLLAIGHILIKRERAIRLVGKTMRLPQLEGLTAYEVVCHLIGLSQRADGSLYGYPSMAMKLLHQERSFFIELKANSEDGYHGIIMPFHQPFYRIMTTTSGYPVCYIKIHPFPC